jgi:hypothetical protein
MKYFWSLFPPIALALGFIAQCYWRFFDGLSAWITFVLALVGFVWVFSAMSGVAKNSMWVAISRLVGGGALLLTVLPWSIAGEPFPGTSCPPAESARQCETNALKEQTRISVEKTGNIVFPDENFDFEATRVGQPQEIEGLRFGVAQTDDGRLFRFGIPMSCTDEALAQSRVRIRQKALSGAFGLRRGSYFFVQLCI